MISSTFSENNIDVIILSGTISVCFFIFIIATIREITNPLLPKDKENSIRAKIVKKVGKIFDSQ